LAFLLLPGKIALSQDQGGSSDPVVRVEEDWGLVLNDPDDAVVSPQFHTVMSPVANLDSVYAQVLWNYREVPDFVPGGLELQMWDGEQLQENKSGREDPLSRSAEVIRWTQVLEVTAEGLSFSIQDGESVSWGSFGPELKLKVSGGLADLSGYSPDVSVQNTCITYGTNRVSVLAIGCVRYYGQSGSLIATDSTPRIVHRVESDPGQE
jgi:hypothetical protein